MRFIEITISDASADQRIDRHIGIRSDQIHFGKELLPVFISRAGCDHALFFINVKLHTWIDVQIDRRSGPKACAKHLQSYECGENCRSQCQKLRALPKN